MGEADFYQLMRLRNPLVHAAENFAREEILTPMLTPTMSKDMDEQLKLAHNVVDVVDRANRKICVTLLRCNVDKPESSYACPINCKEEGGREVLTSCLCDI